MRSGLEYGVVTNNLLSIASKLDFSEVVEKISLYSFLLGA